MQNLQSRRFSGEGPRPDQPAGATRSLRRRLRPCREGRFRAMARLEDYSFGRLTVDGEEHTRDLIVLPRRVVANWWRRDGHSLVLEDLEEVLDELPVCLIVGTGAQGRLSPDPKTLERLRESGIEVDVLPTDEAVRRYGALNPAATAAALHLTCWLATRPLRARHFRKARASP